MTVAILLPGSCPQQVPAGSVLPAVGRALRPPIHSFPGGGSTRISANQDGGAGRPGHAGSGSPRRVLRPRGMEDHAVLHTRSLTRTPQSHVHRRMHAHTRTWQLTHTHTTLAGSHTPHSHTFTHAQPQARTSQVPTQRSHPHAGVDATSPPSPSKLQRTHRVPGLTLAGTPVHSSAGLPYWAPILADRTSGA